MKEARYIKSYIGWWEEDWINVLAADAQLAWMKFQERGKTHGIGGVVPKFSIPTVARQWLQGEESIRKMLMAAEIAGEIRDEGECWVIVHWRRDQGDETGADRQRRFKSKQKGNVGNALPAFGNAGNAEDRIGEEKTRESNPPTPLGEKKPPKPENPATPQRLRVPPALEWCLDFAESLDMPRSEGAAFFDYWESAGWKRKGGKMADWEASMRTWKRNGFGKQGRVEPDAYSGLERAN